jgi:hypothetical protein
MSAGVQKWKNVGLLSLGFGIGQGSLFLIQTWLLAFAKRPDIVGLVGGHLSFAMLGLFVVDGGSVNTMAVRMHDAGRAPAEAWTIYWSTTAFRLIVAGILSVAAFWGGFGLSEFSRGFAAWIPAAFLVWAFNPAGLLDGLRLSGFAGFASGCLYALPSLSLLFVTGSALSVVGGVVGAAFVAGTVATVLIQFIALRWAAFPLAWARPSARQVREACSEGLAMQVNTLPGQVFYRFQILVAGTALGAAGLGILVYVKQIINASTQFTSFVRRAEFVSIVETHRTGEHSLLGATASASRSSISMAIVLTVIAGLFGYVSSKTGFLDREVCLILMFFSPLIAVNSIYLSIVQGFVANKQYRDIAIATQVVLWSSVGITYFIARFLDLRLFAAAEIAGQLLGMVLLVLLAIGLGSRRRPSGRIHESPVNG